MTHETKAGLVVSGSFLCLVTTVLICKLKDKDPEPVPYAQAEGAMPLAIEPSQETTATPVSEQSPAQDSQTPPEMANAHRGSTLSPVDPSAVGKLRTPPNPGNSEI